MLRIRPILSLDDFFTYAENTPIKPATDKNFNNGDRIIISNIMHYYLRSCDIFFTKREIEKMYQNANDYQKAFLLGYVER
mgnify:CR=1 FL=1